MRLNGVAFVKVHHMKNRNGYMWVNMALVMKMFKERDPSGNLHTVLVLVDGSRVRTPDTSDELLRGGKP